MSEEFQLMDRADEQQIVSFDTDVKQALVYVAKGGKKQLSYAGIQYLVLKLSAAGHPLVLVSDDVELCKDVDEDQNTWQWRAKVVKKNTNTGFETMGVQESPYLDRHTHEYDPFGRTKAVSKAMRNADRGHLPMAEIQRMINTAEASDIEHLSPRTERASIVQPEQQKHQPAGTAPPSGQNVTGPTSKQLNMINDLARQLNRKVDTPKSKFEASELISTLLKETNKTSQK